MEIRKRTRFMPDSPQVRDIHEIINYRKAMGAAVEKMAGRPFGINTIRELHRILLTGVRGRYKDPGEIRRIQNYIASPGTPIDQATFIPPSPEMIMDALSNWEDYLYETEKDPLVQLAILKAQFELIHPFRDGNGRIGRMLVPIILYHKKILSQPMFYISAYLERNRDVYYERLLGNIQRWRLERMDIVLPGGPCPAIGRKQQESKSYSGAVQRHEDKGGKDHTLSVFHPDN